MSEGFDTGLSLPKVPSLARCRLSSVEDIWNAINVFRNQGWVYRGHADASWKLVTSLERHKPDATHEDELRAIKDYRNETIGRIDYGDSLVDWLSSMQHYGAPTRLLDFSRSLFVALYFAFVQKNRKDAKSDDREVWALNLRQVFQRSYTVHQYIELRKERALAQGLDPRQIDDVKDGENLLYDLYDDERSRAERLIANKILIKGAKERGVVPVELPRNNDRLIAQKGLFLMPLSDCHFEDNLKTLMKKESLGEVESVPLLQVERWIGSDDFLGVRFVLSDMLRADVMRLLSDVNVSASSIFPDLAGIAQSIEYC